MAEQLATLAHLGGFVCEQREVVTQGGQDEVLRPGIYPDVPLRQAAADVCFRIAVARSPELGEIVVEQIAQLSSVVTSPRLMKRNLQLAQMRQ